MRCRTATEQIGVLVAERSLAGPSTLYVNADSRGFNGDCAPMERGELISRLNRAGELELSGENPEALASYFDTATFRFHGADGSTTDYAGLMGYFRAVREAFDDLSIRRGIIVAEGRYLACQSWIEGTFVREFTQSPAGPLPPNGKRITWDLQNIFRFDDKGRLAEEWVRTDNLGFLRQLGAEFR